MLHSLENAHLKNAYVQVLENSLERNSKKNWPVINAHNRRLAEERQKEIVPSSFANCLQYNDRLKKVVLNGNERLKIVKAPPIGRTAGAESVSLECHLSDDENSTFFDVTIFPRRPFDAIPLKSVESYLSKYAPWIALHSVERRTKEHPMMVRYQLKDETVLNRMLHLIGRDSKRTDFKQMDFLDKVS